MVFITEVREETKLGPTVVYSAPVSVEDAVDDAIHIIDLYKRTCSNVILDTSSVYNMTMQLLTFNKSGKFINYDSEFQSKLQSFLNQKLIAKITIHRIKLWKSKLSHEYKVIELH